MHFSQFKIPEFVFFPLPNISGHEVSCLGTKFLARVWHRFDHILRGRICTYLGTCYVWDANLWSCNWFVYAHLRGCITYCEITNLRNVFLSTLFNVCRQSGKRHNRRLTFSFSWLVTWGSLARLADCPRYLSYFFLVCLHTCSNHYCRLILEPHIHLDSTATAVVAVVMNFNHFILKTLHM
jgi:hypothetical protein